MNLYLLKYNNYYNRIVKKEDSLTDYIRYSLGDPIIGVNFIPGDDVITTQIVNWNKEDPDYLLVTEGTDTIVSRWFVIETVRTRKGQLKLTLHRDLVVDFYNNIIDAPCFIEKATLQDSDPGIYNNEDMTFNQIKMGEEVLQDETKSAWIVGYCTSKTEDEEGKPLEMSADFNTAIGADLVAEGGIANWKYYKYSNLAGSSKQDLAGYPSNIAYCVYSKTQETFPSVYKVCFNASGGQPCGLIQKTAAGESVNKTGYDDAPITYSDDWNPVCDKTSLTLISSGPWISITQWINAFKPYYATLKNQVPSYIPVASEADTATLNDYNGKIIYDPSTQKYYSIAITREDSVWSETPIAAGSMYNTLLEAYNARANSYAGDWKLEVMNGTVPNENTFAIRTYGAKYTVTLTELVDRGNEKYNITIGIDRYHLNDSPYDMFAIPYSDDLVIYKNSVAQFTANKLLAFQAVMALVRKYQAAGYIYDVQLLPFCPVRSMIKADGSFDIGDNPINFITHTPLSGIPENIGVVVYASKSSDTFNIVKSITYTNKKISAMCDKYRLCSPNYNGQFEFSAAYNNGIDYFNVDFTYKPYTPYIHINPNFKNLYGQDWNDSRGLICGGEFSLPAVSNQWDTYELQNKNYQNIFDRQIQNMEVNNSIQRTRDIVGAITGTIGGGTTGAAAGGMIAGPAGMAVGATIGTVTSAAGGIADVVTNEQLRTEALDYTKDLYGYQLGNIKALPYTLTRTTAFTYNNKIFPILEYYTCTEEEKEALANKIAYNGMTVMRIGKISNFKNNSWSYNDIEAKGYVKGQLIKLDNLKEDYHIATAIADEIYKGVFI